MNSEERANILLRLWAGRTDAAKMIRDTYVVCVKKYPSGNVITCEEKINSEERRMAFGNKIDILSIEYHLYN